MILSEKEISNFKLLIPLYPLNFDIKYFTRIGIIMDINNNNSICIVVEKAAVKR